MAKYTLSGLVTTVDGAAEFRETVIEHEPIDPRIGFDGDALLREVWPDAVTILRPRLTAGEGVPEWP